MGKIPWKMAWQPTPIFLLGEGHGQRSLVGHSPWGRKESDTTEATEHARTARLETGETESRMTEEWKIGVFDFVTK